MAIQKRYQYYSKEGVKWTQWFPCSNAEEKWQNKKSKLLNEYKYENS